MRGSSLQGKAFGLADYWRMYKARGIKLPVNYFLQAHAFDLIHGTDTHSWIVQASQGGGRETKASDAIDEDTLYRCSWTSEVEAAFEVLRETLGKAFENYVFIDIGCGKGKVVFVWAMALNRYGMKQKLLGMDYYKPFIQVAKKNQAALDLHDNISFEFRDATEFDYVSLGPNVIAYLYNPFGREILRKVLARLSEANAMIVYNNPVYADEVYAAGYEAIWRKRGWHPNTQTLIFRKRKT